MSRPEVKRLGERIVVNMYICEICIIYEIKIKDLECESCFTLTKADVFIGCSRPYLVYVCDCTLVCAFILTLVL